MRVIKSKYFVHQVVPQRYLYFCEYFHLPMFPLPFYHSYECSKGELVNFFEFFFFNVTISQEYLVVAAPEGDIDVCGVLVTISVKSLSLGVKTRSLFKDLQASNI